MTRDPGSAGRRADPDPAPRGDPAGPADPDPAPRADPDPGLAGARTRLAWLRTAIAFAAIGGVILHRDVPAGLVILVLSGVVWLTGGLAGAPGTVTRPRRLLLIALAVAAVSVLALAVSLFGHEPPGLRL